MSPWEIWSYEFEGDIDTHPVVIFTPAPVSANPDIERVNVLLCTTLRGRRHYDPKPHEVILDSADGLDWATRCRCDAFHYVPKAKLRQRRGQVSLERRRAISQTVLRFFPFVF